MDDTTATLIALKTQEINDGGGRVKAVRLTPNNDPGASGPTITLDVEFSPCLEMAARSNI